MDLKSALKKKVHSKGFQKSYGPGREVNSLVLREVHKHHIAMSVVLTGM